MVSSFAWLCQGSHGVQLRAENNLCLCVGVVELSPSNSLQVIGSQLAQCALDLRQALPCLLSSVPGNSFNPEIRIGCGLPLFHGPSEQQAEGVLASRVPASCLSKSLARRSCFGLAGIANGASAVCLQYFGALAADAPLDHHSEK